MKKPTWDEYFMELAEVVKRRADCLSRQIGCLLVKDLRIMATGYNGTPHGIVDCSKGGCDRCQKRHRGELKSGEQEESCVCIHAEQNAIIQAAYLGLSSKGSTLFSTSNPCSSCAKMLINAGIVRVVCKMEHHDKEGIELLKKAGVKVEIK
ncbi:cytidine/deoxycytidylate deaminase family protein [Patescibacteria group bacterium]|nr:cytidine/deoxycytidylate deaminase family protein [Patescibacteria group bacterium]